MMKRTFFATIMVLLSLTALAGETMGSLFKVMPDSIIPTLSNTNRLDMIDFMEAKMKAEVTNTLDGTSQMMALTDDSLSLRMSDALTIEMFLVDTEEIVDSISQVICVIRTYQFLREGVSESTATFYSVRWRQLEQMPKISVANRRRIEAFQRSSILKPDDELATKKTIL